MAERTTITIDRDLLIEAQRTAARKGVPMGVAGSTSKFIRFLLQDYCARNPASRNGEEKLKPPTKERKSK